jgi:hypothetical protein
MKHEKPVQKSTPNKAAAKRKPAKKAARKAAKGARAPGLVIRPGKDGPLGKTQQQFNKLMKSLEKTRERHALEQARLDDALQVSMRELMPLVEGVKRLNRDLVTQGMEAMRKMKLTARRRESFSDLLHGKASDLLMDPVGLSDEDIEKLKAIADELGPDEEEKRLMDEEDADEFDYLREMIEAQARAAGIEVDLSGLDIHSGSEEFERQLRERLEEAVEQAGRSQAAAPEKPRKLTKAQAEKEQKRLELELARNRDLKSLFKQLAKAFHPDLESDPVLRLHKESWMKRLNSAYAADDLREMLQLEMEWLGEEASNLDTAGDDKLKVYCTVLKEQIAELKERIHFLLDEPQYGPLRRFRNPYHGTLANPETIKRSLEFELEHHRDMLETLTANNAASRRMVNEWADANARASEDRF